MFRIIGLVLVAMVEPSAASAQWTAEQRLLSMFEWIPEDLDSLDPEDISLYQRPIQGFGFVGREDIAESMLENAPSLTSTEACPERGTVADFLEQLEAEAADTRIVMLNESHFEPRHRLLVVQIAERLVEQGYEFFAAETFNIWVAEGRAPGSVPYNIGAYSYEPVYARMLRRIDELYLTTLAYEQTPEQVPENPETWEERINARETAQAANMMDALFDHDQDAKVIIFVGGGHLFEQPVNNEGREEVRWFGNRLAEATGVNHVTIYQTKCSSEGTTVWADGSETNISHQVDHFIAHPPVEFERNRPTWRREIGDIDTDIPAELLSESERVIVEAHPAGGSTEEVAIDRLMLFPGEDIPLLLPPGRYDVRSWTADGLLGGPVEISVGD
ncbi:hypothetical protein [Hyphobacterium sp.]|uniref:hypothetical protein n=1 Tax=Hyphobacterium sp. TaxID=2004662 RepID=UPI003B521856